MIPPAIVFRNVVKRSKDRIVLDNLEATVPAGQLVALAGPRGAGKTMLLRLIAGLVSPDAGTLEVLGHDPRTDTASIQEATGYMPQLPGLFAHLSLVENLRLHGDLRGLISTRLAARVDDVLRQTGLTPLASVRADALPHAARKKLSLACALIGTPRVLLLDEPGDGLDPVSRRDILELARDRVMQGATVLWSTSSFDEAECCSHAILLDRGRIVAQGAMADIGEHLAGRVRRIRAIGPARRRIAARLRIVPGIALAQIESDAVRFVAEKPLQPGGCDQLDEVGPSRPAVPRLADTFSDAVDASSSPALATPGLQTRATAAGTAIETRGLAKRFGGAIAVGGLDLAVPYGEIFGLLGPAGSGKSTILQTICGLLAPSAGEATIADVDVRRAPPGFRRRFGYMGQYFSLYRELSVTQNLDFFAAAYGVPRRQRRDRINRLLSDFALIEFAKVSADKLEPSVQQRLGLAAALVHEPAIVLVDDPTAGVDPSSHRLIWDRLGSIADSGGAVLVATRSATDGEECDRLTMLHQGQAIATGRPDELAKSDAAIGSLENAFAVLLADRDRRRAA